MKTTNDGDKGRGARLRRYSKLPRRHGPLPTTIPLESMVVLVAATISYGMLIHSPQEVVLGVAWILFSALSLFAKLGFDRLDHPVILTFVLGVFPSALGLTVAPFSQYRLDDESLRLAWTVLTIFVLIAVLLAPRLSKLSIEISPKYRSSLASVQGVSLFVFAASAAYYFRTNGIPLLQFNAEQARVDAVSGLGPVVALLEASALIGASTTVLQHEGLRTRRQIAVVLTIAVVLALTGSRSSLLKVGIASAAIYFSVRSVRRRKFKLLCLAGVAAVVMAVIGDIRYSGSDVSAIDVGIQRLAADGYSSQLILTDPTPDPRVLGFSLFRTAAATYLPGNQPLVGQVLKETLGLEFAGGAVAVPLPAEGALFAGGFGVLFFAALAALLPSLSAMRGDSTTRMLVNVLFGATWAGVYGSGIATTVFTYLIPLALFSSFLIFLFRRSTVLFPKAGSTHVDPAGRSKEVIHVR